MNVFLTLLISLLSATIITACFDMATHFFKPKA